MATQIAAGDDRLAQLIVSQLVNTTARGNEVHTRDLNLALTVVQGIEPKDTVETLLATQMAAVYIETMKAGRKRPDDPAARFRLDGGQQARAYICGAGRSTVNEGGQAIVGIVSPQGGRGCKNREPTS
jgi:hypothetical protein